VISLFFSFFFLRESKLSATRKVYSLGMPLGAIFKNITVWFSGHCFLTSQEIPMKTFPCCASLLIFALFTTVGFSQDQSDKPTKRAAFIKKFDKDGDGKLSESEREAAKKAAAKRGNKGQPSDPRKPGPDRQALLKKFDKDGDGKLNTAEQAALRSAMQKKRGPAEKGPGKGRPNMKQLLAKYDTNGDGKLDAKERAKIKKPAPRPETERNKQTNQERQQKLLQRFDKDGDGELSPAERRAMKEFLEKRRAERGPNGPRPAGNGKPNVPRNRLDQKKVLKQFDVNGDGKLDASEKTAARNAVRKKTK